jgi:AcrR family transcriptional regulator
MQRAVKPESVRDLRADRVSRTEAAVVDAARELFTAQGYVPTTLTQVAEQAGVATRTVFVRFGSKAALFRALVDRTLAGGDLVDVAAQARTQEALSAPTLPQRVDALVDVTAGIMRRAGALFDVAAQAEGLEPELADAWRAGRRATAELAATFWRHAADDGLLPDGVDAGHLAVTTDVLICADTMVHLRRTRNWSARSYRQWLTAALRALAPD